MHKQGRDDLKGSGTLSKTAILGEAYRRSPIECVGYHTTTAEVSVDSRTTGEPTVKDASVRVRVRVRVRMMMRMMFT
jgi:hypothetical protein